MSRLILLRHGQSQWNAAGRFTGWVDVPLSRKGVEEALEASEELSNESIDVVYMSGLQRAQQTAMIALCQGSDSRTPIMIHESGLLAEWSAIHDDEAAKLAIPCYIDQCLNERYYGELQGLKKEVVAKEHGEAQCQVWRRGYDTPPPGGESLQDTAERVLPLLHQTFLPILEADKTCLVVAHGNSLRAMVMEMESLTANEVQGLEIPTGQPRAYEYTEGRFVLQE